MGLLPQPLARAWARHAGLRNARALFAATGARRLVIGAAGIYQPGWVPTDRSFLDLQRDKDWQRLLDGAPVDALLAEHVWEHIEAAEALIAAQSCYRHLRAGGHLRVAVPDGLHPEPSYIAAVRPGGSGAGAQDHRVLYRHDSFAALFRGAGFEVRPLEHFDEAGRFRFEDWDPRDGMVWRSLRYDARNRDGKPNYSSIVLDAYK